MGVLFLGLMGIWLAVSLWIAWLAAKRVKPIWQKVLLGAVVAPLVYVAPVGDELIGKFQYERYCEESENVKIYGTIPVGLELYTADGKWKVNDMSLSLEEQTRMANAKKSLIRWDVVNPSGTEVPGAIPIQYKDTKIYEVKTGRLLAEFRIYSTRGGSLSRIVSERAGFLVKPQCLPRLLREGLEEQSLLPFNGKTEGAK